MLYLESWSARSEEWVFNLFLNQIFNKQLRNSFEFSTYPLKILAFWNGGLCFVFVFVFEIEFLTGTFLKYLISQQVSELTLDLINPFCI